MPIFIDFSLHGLLHLNSLQCKTTTKQQNKTHTRISPLTLHFLAVTALVAVIPYIILLTCRKALIICTLLPLILFPTNYNLPCTLTLPAQLTPKSLSTFHIEKSHVNVQSFSNVTSFYQVLLDHNIL